MKVSKKLEKISYVYEYLGFRSTPLNDPVYWKGCPDKLCIQNL